MAEILLENDLRDVINALQQATDANRSVVIDTANDIMTNFVNGNLELDDNALTAFADFLMAFGVTRGADGKTTFNSKVAEQAADYLIAHGFRVVSGRGMTGILITAAW